MNDAVKSPKHYQQGYIETIYAIAQTLGPEGFKAYCMGNWIKYSSRHKLKGGQEDLDKAEVYLGWAANGLPELTPTPEQSYFIAVVDKASPVADRASRV